MMNSIFSPTTFLLQRGGGVATRRLPVEATITASSFVRGRCRNQGALCLKKQFATTIGGLSVTSISSSSSSSLSSSPNSLFASFSTSAGDKTPETVEISIKEAQSTTALALEKIGWDQDDAAIQAEIMVAAELCGNNQGLVKMYDPKMMQPSPEASKPTWEKLNANSAVLNANQAPGMLAAVMCADKAIEMCRTEDNTISVVCSNNTSTSSGQLAFYVERIARQGLVGICFANSPEFVAAAKGGSRVFGTNPLAIGIPQANSPYPFTFDMATSAIALFGVLSSKAKGEPLPPEVAYGKDGDWCTNAEEVLKDGAIATFGGHKGTGLSLTVELLAGALSGAAVLGMCTSKVKAKSWGHTFICINPNDLVDYFDLKAASIVNTVKSSAGDGGNNDMIRIPGERSMKTAEERKKAGVMPIPIKIWESIVNTSQNGITA